MIDVESILLQQSQNLPRYTSYPPANHFVPLVGQGLENQFLAAARAADAISVYIHIPYCDRLCWFCGCHTKHTLSYDPIAAYVTSLVKEIKLFGDKLAARKAISKIHLGGGSPSLLKECEFTKIRSALEGFGQIDQETEVSLEIDPTDIQSHGIDAMMAFGLTRASIGVQDFDPLVQAAINRPQSFEVTQKVVQSLREAGVTSINIDALYGLPLQTPERFHASVDKVLELSPDRIALFGYAHVPWLKPHQKLINDTDLPDQAARLHSAVWAAGRIAKNGYQVIGIDHFAKPQDRLATAARGGKLRRSFQGYTDDPCDVVVGLGPSSISQFAGGFLQNEVATGRYVAAVAQGNLTGRRGLAVGSRDQVRGWIIERLMCDFAFSRAALFAKFGEDAAMHWQHAQTVSAEDAYGLSIVEGDIFRVKDGARPLVRQVAAQFDAWLRNTRFQYSKAV
ncbi:MAG: oxygen-independent coproporphyrinogen III oxidase [Alphaproteobacteria bacterium]|nr:oxygen-independent coproporphyrinogen III oxidase [Alphaproteobacteria bacterium]